MDCEEGDAKGSIVAMSDNRYYVHYANPLVLNKQFFEVTVSLRSVRPFPLSGHYG
jgi:hypothetical protein